MLVALGETLHQNNQRRDAAATFGDACQQVTDSVPGPIPYLNAGDSRSIVDGMRFRNVGVLMGGCSSEREISLTSGRAVVEGLREAGYLVTPVILDQESVTGRLGGLEAVFIALHGGYGENGGVQADLDALRMPYTGSGAAASRTAMCKIATKKLLVKAGIPTAGYEVLSKGMDCTRLPLPVVVKPPRDGSSVGISCVRSPADWPAALAEARSHDAAGEVLVETYLPGREWTVGVVGEEAFPVIEIQPPNGWYDFKAKYTKGASQYVFPEGAEFDALTKKCRDLALAAFRAVGCRGLGRVDFRVLPDGRPFVLEINTIPGFTPTSLLPKAAARAGIAFPHLCDRIQSLARCDSAEAR
jgi:D-alanine-D-alanine ligase